MAPLWTTTGRAYLSYWMLWGAKGHRAGHEPRPRFRYLDQAAGQPGHQIHRVGHHRGQGCGREDLPLRFRRPVQYLEEGWPLLHAHRQSAGPEQDWPRPERPALGAGRPALPLRLGRPEDLEIPARLLRAEPRVDRPQRRQHVSQLPAVAVEPRRRAAEREAPAAVHQPQQRLPILCRRLPERPVHPRTTTDA